MVSGNADKIIKCNFKDKKMAIDDPFLFEEDAYYTPEFGAWATTKHEKIGYYSRLFSSSMKSKWDCRIYIDLFAGAGKCKLKESSRVVPGSPLLSLSVTDPFDKYIFCEKDPRNMEALKSRVYQYYASRDVSFIQGDTNEALAQLFSLIPKFGKGYKGLALCFVDPYKKGELDFSTIKTISEKLFVDFLVLLPSYMDIHRNEGVYTSPNNKSLDMYLGTDQWRREWSHPDRQYKEFGMFIADQFCNQMKELGYLYEGPKDLELIKGNCANNLRLYHLAFFSKNPLGLKFWRETQKNTTRQLSLLGLGEKCHKVQR